MNPGKLNLALLDDRSSSSRETLESFIWQIWLVIGWLPFRPFWTFQRSSRTFLNQNLSEPETLHQSKFKGHYLENAYFSFYWRSLEASRIWQPKNSDTRGSRHAEFQGDANLYICNGNIVFRLFGPRVRGTHYPTNIWPQKNFRIRIFKVTSHSRLSENLYNQK